MTSEPTALTGCEIRVGDLLLRPFEEADEPAVARELRDPAILRWAAGLAVLAAPEPERARVWLAPRIAGWQRGNPVFAVTDVASGALLGSVGLRDVNRIPGQAMLGYWVAPVCRGRGIAPRALDAVSRWAFAPAAPARGVGLHRLNLTHVVLNTASCRVAVKAGFPLEGTMRDEFVEPDGRRFDSHLHARIATDQVAPLA